MGFYRAAAEAKKASLQAVTATLKINTHKAKGRVSERRIRIR